MQTKAKTVLFLLMYVDFYVSYNSREVKANKQQQ